jgi:hypothetical protein
MRYTLQFLCLIVFYSCIYKAGNRVADVNKRYDVSVSPFYIKEYLKSIDSFYTNRMVVTSEIVNYAENFIPVTDSLLGFKYVIEFHNLDSISYLENHYINLASIYDFKKGCWITDIDSLKNNELKNFELFFKDSVLVKVVKQYKNKIPHSLLFINKKEILEIKPL